MLIIYNNGISKSGIYQIQGDNAMQAKKIYLVTYIVNIIIDYWLMGLSVQLYNEATQCVDWLYSKITWEITADGCLFQNIAKCHAIVLPQCRCRCRMVGYPLLEKEWEAGHDEVLTGFCVLTDCRLFSIVVKCFVMYFVASSFSRVNFPKGFISSF